MAPINPPNPAAANAQVQTLVINLRDVFDRWEDYFGWFSTLSLADVATVFGVDQPTAQIIQSTVGNHDKLRQCYEGLVAVTPPFNFKANGAALWGGQ
jgi:hypothetical protein